jgi:hypothetical protein
MWTTSSGISTDTSIYCFRRCGRYDPLGAKLRRHSRDNMSMAEVFNSRRGSHSRLGRRVCPAAQSPPTSVRHSPRRLPFRHSPEQRQAPRRQRQLRVRCQHRLRAARPEILPPRQPRPERRSPPGKRFDAHSLLDAPCIYHSREGKPSTHTTANFFSLKQIEKARRAKENGVIWCLQTLSEL